MKNTWSLVLQYRQDNYFRIASNILFADNSIDQKSSQVYTIKLFRGVIGWRASKQETVTMSTTEAELLVLSQATKEALFVSRLIKELKIKLDNNYICIKYNNKQTICLVTKEIATLQTKLHYIDIHNYWLYQEVQNRTISIEYTESTRIIADSLTKVLQNNNFLYFVEYINLRDIYYLLAKKRELDLQELEIELLKPNKSDLE